jgi:small-conductance mechanosensitive channel/CRP-like cAMP-binding protein
VIEENIKKMSYQDFIGSGVLEGLVILLVLCFGLVLYGLLHFFNKKFLLLKGKKIGLFLSRIITPIAFLIAVLCVRAADLIQRLQLNPQLGKYLDAAALFLLFFFLIKLTDSIFVTTYERREITFPLPRVLHRFVLFLFYLVVLFIVLEGVAGIDITPLLATSAILTMILGLAFQELLGNIVSGMSLHLVKSFSKGDWIKSGDKEGEVIDTNWRETRIKDFYSNIVVVPNNSMASEVFVNYSRPAKKTALTLPIKVSYGSSPLSVMKALKEAALDSPEVLAEPPPEAYILSYEDFGISYVLKFWIPDFSKKYQILGKVGRLIWYKFRRKGIEIPVPIGDKVEHVLKSLPRTGVTEFPGQKGEENQFYSLMNSSFLRYQSGKKAGELIVPEDEIKKLASSIKKQTYSQGETVFRQGDKGESCFIVVSGKVKGIVNYKEKEKKYRTEFTINPGEIFGEMSLYTGMPRTATCWVDEETQLLEIGTEDFALLLSRNPDLAEMIADMVSMRNKENQDFLKKIRELSEKDIQDSCNKKSLLNRMRKFIASLTLKK